MSRAARPRATTWREGNIKGLSASGGKHTLTGPTRLPTLRAPSAEKNDPVSVVDLPVSKITCAAWGPLNKYIYAGHENGDVAAWDWQVCCVVAGLGGETRRGGARPRHGFLTVVAGKCGEP